MTLNCGEHTAKNKTVSITVEEDYSSISLNRWKIKLIGSGEGEGGRVSYEFYSVPINRVTGEPEGRPKYIGGDSTSIEAGDSYTVSTSSVDVTAS